MVIVIWYLIGVIEYYKGCSIDEYCFVCFMEDELVDLDENVYCCRIDMCNFVVIILLILIFFIVYK